jgi:protein-L-isoaspartate(D-aspartate) O-methyltransferase
MLTQRGIERQQNNEGLMALLLRLRALNIDEKPLLEAIEQTPRDRFVPVQCIARPYFSRAFPMECGQSMTGVDQVVRTVNAMGLSSKHAVLEIGTGTGYQAALIARLAKKVVTIDRFRRLTEKAKQRFEHLGIDNIVVQHADGHDGISDQRLFDRIVVNGSFAGFPRQFLDHLTSGGMMVTAIGEVKGTQMLVRLTKIGSRFDREDLFSVRMAALRSGVAEFL